MIYLVTSLPRSGSSMMMRCLESGGMNIFCDKSLDAMYEPFIRPDYDPNPNGFYSMVEVSNEEMPDFYKNYDGKTVKFEICYLDTLPPGDYSVVVLRRNPEEIRKSMHAFQIGKWEDEDLLDDYENFIKTTMDKLISRGGFKIITLNYADIVANPKIEFQKLKDFGFPIDVDIAASKVEPNLYRFKLENQ